MAEARRDMDEATGYKSVLVPMLKKARAKEDGK